MATPPSQKRKPPDPGDEPAAFARLHIWQFQAVRDVLLVLAVVALVWLGYALRAVTVPLLIALLLAYLFEPAVSRMAAQPWLKRRGETTARSLTVGSLMCTGGLLLAVVLFVVTVAVVNQGAGLIADIRAGRFEQRAEHLLEFIPAEHREPFERLYRRLFDPVEDVVTEPDDEPDAAAEEEAEAPAGDTGPAPPEAAVTDEERIRQIVRDEMLHGPGELAPGVPPLPGVAEWWVILTGGAGHILRFVVGMIAFGFLLFLIPFYLFFFSVGYPRIVEFGKGLIPEASRPQALELLAKMDRVVAGFVRGRIIVSLLMGVGFAIGWWIIGVPYAILLGFVVGLFCAVPFLGIIGVPLAVGLLFFQQLELPAEERMAWWAIIFWPTLVFIIVQAIESYALTPAIAGKATNLDPVTIIVAVLAGASLMGVYGMLLAIPVAACLKILITDVLLPRVRAWTRGEVKDPLPIE